MFRPTKIKWRGMVRVWASTLCTRFLASSCILMISFLDNVLVSITPFLLENGLISWSEAKKSMSDTPHSLPIAFRVSKSLKNIAVQNWQYCFLKSAGSSMYSPWSSSTSSYSFLDHGHHHEADPSPLR